MKNLFIITLLLISFSGYSQEEEKKTPITVTELAPGIHRLFVNNRVAVTAFTGDEGLLIIDAAYQGTANDLAEQLKLISTKPLSYIINTHIHGDHTGGNLVLGKDVNIIAHQNVKEYLSKEQGQGERVTPAFPDFAQPNITFNDSMGLDFNGQLLQLIHLPKGHTSGDIVIFFPKNNVLVVGDLLFANYFPYVDVGNGGNPLHYIENIDFLTENFPSESIVVGGHGPVYTIDNYKQYRNTLKNTMDIVKKLKQEGMTAEEMKEKRVLKEWESFGSFFITEDRWIDTVYPFL
jgi:glyoxylase-like metal-dependent hydrolase (beta-lactamase superfamily II)